MTDADRAMRARRDDIEARAREWMSCLYSGEFTEQDRIGLQAWLAESTDHRAAFQSLSDLWTSLDRVPAIEAGLHVMPPCAANVTKPAAWRAFLQANVKLRFAAALIVAMAAIVALATLQMPYRADPQHFVTAVGEVRELELTDGSQVVLRADSAIQTALSDQQRSVTIERGGAYFEVSKDESRPFVVSAGSIDVRVYGTAFDVLKGPSSVTVSVTHGRVSVCDPEAGCDAHAVELTAGQQLLVQADGVFGPIVAFDSERVLGWRDGRLSYLNARLEDVVADINRYREQKILLEDRGLGELRITTMFRADNVDQMLAGLEATQPVTIVRSASAITIRRRQRP